MIISSRYTQTFFNRFLSSSASTSVGSQTDFHREEVNGKLHVSSINIQTKERAIVQLKTGEHSQQSRKFTREFSIPPNALSGLKNVLVSCSKTAKQLQHEADQLSNMLDQRRFPASPDEVRLAREEIRRKLRLEHKESNDVFDQDGILSQKIIEAKEQQIQHKVQRYLKKTRYNWKPLDFDSRDSAAKYALARFVPNYAEISRVLEELKITRFAPETVLDFGSGAGSGFWAVNQMYEKSLKEYCLVDLSDEMTKLSMDIMRKDDGTLLSKKVSFRRHLLPSLQTTYDLVICHRTLCEIGSPESRIQTIESLWRRTNKYLVLIESGLDDSFNAILDARDYLLTSGVDININELLSKINEQGIPEQEVIALLHDRHLSNFEKYSILKEKFPNMEIPTKLPHSSVFAPCPHDLGCPLRNSNSCSFSLRWRTLRADGKQKDKTKDGTETGNISFVILEKGARGVDRNLPRILKLRKMNGHVTCDVCTSFNGLQRFTLSKRGGEMYKRMKTRITGELSPFQMETKATEGVFDLYDQVLKNMK